MKRRSLVILAVVLVMVLSLAFAACGPSTPQAPPVKLDVMEFTQGATLSSVKLPSGFAWKNPATTIKVGKNLYDATYKEGDQSVDVQLALEMKLTQSLLDEEVSMDYIENLLASDAFKKDGAKYASAEYDQYVMILARSARGIKKSTKDAYLARVKDVVLPAVSETNNMAIVGEGYNAINYTNNTVMTLIALGESTVIDGVDLAAPFYDEALTVVDNIYALNVSVNIVKNLNIPAKYKTKDGVEHTSTTTLDKVVAKMMDLKNSSGAWNFMPEGVDMNATTMALSGLADIKSASDVESIINIVKAQPKTEKGAYQMIDYMTGEPVADKNSTATAILAFASFGVNPTTIKNDAGKDIMSYLQSEDCRIASGDEKGAYWYSEFVAEDGSVTKPANALLTKDALIALISYNRYLKGYDNFYNINMK